MDIQYLITINLMVISALAIVSVLMQLPWRESVLWIGVNALVIVVAAAALQWYPGWAGVIAAAVFIPFVMGPIACSILARKSAMQNQPKRAALFFRLAALLHPSARARFGAAVSAAQAEPTIELQIEAMRAVNANSAPAEAFLSQALLYRLADDWRGIVDHVRKNPTENRQTRTLEIRALGELGLVDEMVRTYDASKDKLVGSDQFDAQLFLFAFSGRPGAVATLLQGSQKWLDSESQTYWSLIAQRAAGAPEPLWKPGLEQLATSAQAAPLRTRSAAKLRQPAEPASHDLTAAANAMVDAAAQRLTRLVPSTQRNGFLATPVTWVLLAALILVYAIEELSGGGSQNLRALVNMGALWPPHVVERNEWWRLLTATFLHFGPIHIGANALMLWMLGQPCERAFGSLRMLIVYLTGGIASSAFVLALYVWGNDEPTVLVGASGAIMAIFGGMVGLRIVSWLRHRDIVDRRFLTMVPLILAIQIAIDLSMPQVSLAAHASGFVAGLIIGTLLAWTMPRAGEPTSNQTAVDA